MMKLVHALSLLLVVTPVLLVAQQPQLLILGTAHLNNPGKDMNNLHVDDVFAPKRQAEIAAIVDHLALLKPTGVALECVPADRAKWDKRYADYRAGTYALTRDERDQIGLRLAAAMKLPRIECVDYSDGSPGPDAAYDFVAYAKAHGQSAQFDSLMASSAKTVATEGEYLSTHTLASFFRELNTPARMQADNALYYQFVQFGDGPGSDSHPGANWVGGWHARNLIIVENVRRLSKPGDRIVAIFGAGHAYLLNQFARESGAFQLLDPAKALPAK